LVEKYGLEEPAALLGLDADAGVRDLERHEAVRAVVARADVYAWIGALRAASQAATALSSMLMSAA
jgi:hypothetical protein